MNILEIKNLCKVYGTGETRVDALKDVSFDIETIAPIVVW